MNFPNKVAFKPRWSYPVVGGEGAEEKKNTKNRGIACSKVPRQEELHVLMEQTLGF